MRNIAIGQRDFQSATVEQVKTCIELAALQTTISEMRKGLETMVGARVNALSGGQKQRIATARARLRNTPILILDVPTSALDDPSRTSVMNAIREWRCDKTTVVITHDMGQIQNDDFVYVLDSGYVVEKGYRNTLVDSDTEGLFSDKSSSPQIPTAPYIDFGLGPVRNLSKSRKLTNHLDAIASKRSSLEERGSIDLHLDSIVEDLDYRPHSVSSELHNKAKGALTRSSSRAKAVASAKIIDDTRCSTILSGPPCSTSLGFAGDAGCQDRRRESTNEPGHGAALYIPAIISPKQIRHSPTFMGDMAGSATHHLRRVSNA